MIERERRLRLRQIRFGNVDARYEVNTRDKKEVDHFRLSFLEPSGMRTEEFVKGHRYIVHGVKGAGKTAFLRYLQLLVQDSHSLHKFISFSTEISDAERQRIAGIAEIDIFEQKDVEVSNNSSWMYG